jgi:hypothetical protein
MEPAVADRIISKFYQAGLAGFLLGLTWAAGSYPWRSAAVLVPMIGGALLLVAFGFWGE